MISLFPFVISSDDVTSMFKVHTEVAYSLYVTTVLSKEIADRKRW